MEEPNLRSERELEDAVGAVARHYLQEVGTRPLAMRDHGLDLAIFSRVGCFLFEAKVLDLSHGRSSCGNRREKEIGTRRAIAGANAG